MDLPIVTVPSNEGPALFAQIEQARGDAQAAADELRAAGLGDACERLQLALARLFRLRLRVPF